MANHPCIIAKKASTTSHSIHSHNSVYGSNTSKDGTASLGRNGGGHQATPDRHPATGCKFDKNRNKQRIGTWNVQTLAQKGKVENLISEMKRLKVNILGVGEMRWKGQGEMNKDGCKIFWSGGNNFERGVGVILDSKTVEFYKGHLAISDRIIMVKIRGLVVDINIIQVYAPTQEAPDQEILKFYSDLEKIKNLCKSNEIVIVMGDLNAKVGKGKDGIVVGDHGLGDRNERGDMWIDWCRENKMFVANTWFENHPRRLWTWMSPGDRTRNQIDYIAVSNRYRNGVLNCKTYPGADIDSDHAPVIMDLRVRLKAVKKGDSNKRRDLNYCGYSDVKEKMKTDFEDMVNKKENFEKETTQNQFETFKNIVLTVMDSHIPPASNNIKKHPWMTTEIMNLIEERRKYKRGSEKYMETNNTIKRKCIEAHQDYLDFKCIQMERDFKGNTRKVHQDIKEITGKGRKVKSSSNCIKDKNGNLLFDEQEIQNRWQEYIGELYDDPERTTPKIVFQTPLTGPDITKDEILHALGQMSKRKATGPDEIPTEVLEALGDTAIDMLHKLFNKIYDSGEIPHEMCNSIFIALPKKPGADSCENFRTISLMSHITKILLRVVINRMRNIINFEISEEQYGFQPDKGTRNAIYVMRTLSERAIEMQTPLFVCFVDYKKAFDKVKHDLIFQQLQEIGIDDKDLRLLQTLYYTQSASIRIGRTTSEPVLIKKGVRQGCVASPDLFNLYQEVIMRGMQKMEGIRVGGVNINNIRYADDTALLTTSVTQLQKIVDRLVVDSGKYGMEVNTKKTECMVVKKESIPRIDCNICIKGENLNCVDSFKYLGSIISDDGRCTKEIKSRIAQAKQAFNALRNVLCNKNMSFLIREKVLLCYVWSILLYGCESWTMNKDLRRNVEAFEMWCLRRMQRISYTAHKTNAEVLMQTYQERKLFRTIIERQLSFFGHIVRKEKNEFLAISGKIIGKRGKGRQRSTLFKQLKEFTGIQDNRELLNSARNRDVWRRTTYEASNAWSRHGT